MIFLLNSKNQLSIIEKKVEKYLNKNVLLDLNHKKTYLENVNRGVLFL
jgi:hypothetical protein